MSLFLKNLLALIICFCFFHSFSQNPINEKKLGQVFTLEFNSKTEKDSARKHIDRIIKESNKNVSSEDISIELAYPSVRYFDHPKAHLLENIYILKTEKEDSIIYGILKNNTHIKRLEKVKEVHSIGVSDITDTYFNSQASLFIQNFDQAFNITLGDDDVRIAIIDNAFSEHPDLINKIDEYPGFNFYRDLEPLSDEVRPVLHGTRVAGTAIAENNGFGVVGCAPNIRWLPYPDPPGKKLDQVPGVSGPFISQNWVESSFNAALNGANVLNYSFAGGYNPEHEIAMEILHDYGVILVAGAGNSIGNEYFYPASYEHVISVTTCGMHYLPNNYTFVNILNDKIDVEAATPFFTTYDGLSIQYGGAGGTSNASPQVAGLAALMLSINPTLTGTGIKNILKETGAPLTEYSSDPAFTGYNFKRIDAYKALRMVQSTKIPINHSFEYNEPKIWDNNSIINAYWYNGSPSIINAPTIDGNSIYYVPKNSQDKNPILESILLDFTKIKFPQLSFFSYQYDNYYGAYSRLSVEISTDNGVNWSEVYYTGNSTNVWKPNYINLQNYAGEKIKIRFKVDTYTSESVVGIDKLEIIGDYSGSDLNTADYIGEIDHVWDENNFFSKRYNLSKIDYGNYYGGNKKDHFIKFDLKNSCWVTISHCGSDVNDTFLYILDDNGNQIDSNDDNNGTCANSKQASIRKYLNTGSYYVVSEGKYENGIIQVSIEAWSSLEGRSSTAGLEWSDFDGTEKFGNNSLRKTNQTGWVSGAASNHYIPEYENGFFEFKINSMDDDIMFGLSYGNQDRSWNTIDFNCYQSKFRGRKILVYQRGSQKLSDAGLTYAVNDIIRLERYGNEVKFKLNGNEFYSLGCDISKALLVDVCLYNSNAEINWAISAQRNKILEKTNMIDQTYAMGDLAVVNKKTMSEMN